MMMMPKIADRIESVIGLDVSKDTVMLHDLQSEVTVELANTPEALRAGLAPYADHQLAVCEATGGHEDAVLAVAMSLGLPIHRGDGGRISAFARSLQRAKTDRIDARMLAIYGRERGENLTRYAPSGSLQARLAALVRHRMDLVDLRKITRTRAKAPRAGHVAPSSQRLLTCLDKEIEITEAQIAKVVAADQHLRRRAEIVTTIPGVGPVVSSVLLALMPELGSLTRKRAASLAAVAPHPRDSGKASLPRTTTGGRRELRPILFQAALTAARGQNMLATFYRRLIEAGKSKRLALVAVMRKIVVIANARLAHPN
jgi:transposase